MEIHIDYYIPSECVIGFGIIIYLLIGLIVGRCVYRICCNSGKKELAAVNGGFLIIAWPFLSIVVLFSLGVSLVEWLVSVGQKK